MSDRSEAARKAWRTRRSRAAFKKARTSEASSKKALEDYCRERGWRVAFFEGPTGAPRTGVIDAVAFRISRVNADFLDLRLIQLKGGNAGVSGKEIARLKHSVANATVRWLIAAFDGHELHLVPELDEG